MISTSGTTSNPVLTASNPDDDTQLNNVILAAREDKLVTKDNIAGQLTDYAKASDLSAKADANDVYSKTDAENTFATKTELGSYATRTELDAKANATALDGKANTDLSNLTVAGETKIKETMSADMANLDGRVGNVEGKVTTLETTVGNATGGLVKDVADLKAQGIILNTELGKKADQTDLDEANKKIATNEGNITDLQNKTAEISHADGDGTRISGVTIKDGNIVGNGNSAITQLANVETDKIKTDSINGKSLTGTTVATEKEVKDVADAVKKETDARTEADNKLEEKITKNTQDIATLNDKVITAQGDITALQAKDNELARNIQTNADNIQNNKKDITTIKQRTAGIDRIDATKETTIEGHVTVDNLGNVKAKGNVTADGKLTGKGVDAGDGAITTTGAVNAGSLTVENASNLKGDVTMDKKLSVTGDTTLKGTTVDGKLTVKDEADLKNTQVNGTLGVTGATTLSGELTAKENATFEKDVTVKGTTNLKNTTVAGDLKVTGTITTDTMVFGVKPTNYTEIDQGKVTSKNSYINGAGQSITSSSTFDVEKNEVGFVNNATGEQSYHKQTAKGINGSVTDKAGNTTYTKVTATENSFQVQDKDGKNKNHQVNTKDSSVTEITNENGNTTKTEQTAKDITNTAKDGTITNDAQNIVNKAATMDTTVTGKATESYGELETTVTGQATQNFNGGLNTTVTGAENHTVTGIQTNTVGGGQVNNISGGQTNNILTGNQETTVSDGSIINKAEHGDISNTAKNVTNEGTKLVTNKVGTNEVKVSKDGVDIKVDADKTIKESVGAVTSRTMTDGNIIDQAGDMTVTTDKTTGTTFGNGTLKDTTVINGGTIGTNKVNANETNTKKLTAGAAADANGGRLTVDADGVKGSYKSGDYTSRSYILPNTLKSGVDNGKKPIDADFVGSRTDHYMDGNKAKLDETVKDTAGSNVTNKTSTGTVTTITDGTTTTKTEQGVKDITNTATGGTIKNDAMDIVNNASNSITEKVGETNVTTKTTTLSKSEIQNADTITSVQQTENMVQSFVGKKDLSVTNVTTNSAEASANAVTKDGQTSTVLNNKDGLLIRNTANRTSFTTDDGTNTGKASEWTNVKGNEISTGKVEANYVKMDYADVMRDLGVRGNANINGKTTTGSLEVTGTSKLTGDVTMENNATVGNNLTVNGTTTTKTLSVTENATVGGTLDVTGKATFKDSVDIAKDLAVGGNATITGDVTAKSYKVGDKTYISADGINANDQKITNVADGSISEGSKDAVNGGQLYGMKTDLEHKVDKVGANAAAMANLHPMEFDPDSKWNIAAAMGNYGSETATAIGAFYRPNEDVMVNFSTAFGTGENMVGGGVSVRLGKGSNKLSREESNALKDQVNDLTARMDALLSVLNPNMSKDFPDVPENHWAYEAVSRLAGNDIVQGYPDGEFHGDRTMTRYEMAEIIYNALSRGAEAERELVEEFKPELQAMAASEKATAERAEG